jgi:class 3 adenylate cyclase
LARLTETLALAVELGEKNVVAEAHKKLALTHEQLGDLVTAFDHFKKYHALDKEVQSDEAKKQAGLLEHRRKIEEAERDRQVKLARFQEQEKILHNILPAAIAERLVSGEKTIADSFEHVSIVFVDIVGFTKLSEHISAEQLVVLLNGIFTEFDHLARKHGLEKIKTIGDAYMAVAGAPLPQDDHALCAAHFALDVAEAIREFRTPSNEPIELRIGIHSGRLVAGIIGENKFAYDLWGDAVNMASRMESHGEVGRIHVSEEFVKELIADSG